MEEPLADIKLASDTSAVSTLPSVSCTIRVLSLVLGTRTVPSSWLLEPEPLSTSMDTTSPPLTTMATASLGLRV